MKRTILIVIAFLTVFGLGMLTGVSRKQSVGAAPAGASLVPAASAAPMPEHRCSAIHEAVQALETAMHDMQEAHHDFCGHKHEAMEATRHALEHLRGAEGCDRCR